MLLDSCTFIFIGYYCYTGGILLLGTLKATTQIISSKVQTIPPLPQNYTNLPSLVFQVSLESMNPSTETNFIGLKQTRKPLNQSRVELFLQFEACIRVTTLWELMCQKNIKLKKDDDDNESQCPKLEDLINFMKTGRESYVSKIELCRDLVFQIIHSNNFVLISIDV